MDAPSALDSIVRLVINPAGWREKRLNADRRRMRTAVSGRRPPNLAPGRFRRPDRADIGEAVEAVERSTQATVSIK